VSLLQEKIMRIYQKPLPIPEAVNDVILRDVLRDQGIETLKTIPCPKFHHHHHKRKRKESEEK